MTREEAIMQIRIDATEIAGELASERKGLHKTVLLIKKLDALDMAIEALKQPEVVRCRDCKYSIYPFQLCKLWKRNANPDDFCSYGERKDGESK